MVIRMLGVIFIQFLRSWGLQKNICCILDAECWYKGSRAAAKDWPQQTDRLQQQTFGGIEPQELLIKQTVNCCHNRFPVSGHSSHTFPLFLLYMQWLPVTVTDQSVGANPASGDANLFPGLIRALLAYHGLMTCDCHRELRLQSANTYVYCLTPVTKPPLVTAGNHRKSLLSCF